MTLESRILESNINYGKSVIERARAKGESHIWNPQLQNWQHVDDAEQAALAGEIHNCNCGEGHICAPSGYCGY